MDKLQRIQEHLSRHDYFDCVEIYEQPGNEVVISIDWGDWKHGHLCVEYLMGLMGYEQVMQNVTESDGSDCYSADHIFRERTEYRFRAAGPYEGDYKAIAKALRDGDEAAAEKAADILEGFLSKNDVIVPMPSHDGRRGAVHRLCERLSARTGLPLVDALTTKKARKSMCEAKKELAAGSAARLPFPEEMMMIPDRMLPEGRRPVIIDNVIASGTTAVAALNAIRNVDAVVLALADDGNCKKIITFDQTNETYENQGKDKFQDIL